MKKIVLLLGLLILTTYAAMASESAPLAHINYQGKLTNATGAPVSDGAHTIVFKFFQAETGGTSLWESTRSVQTADGLFSTVISPLPGDMFRSTLGAGSDLWLEIVADGSTLSPRTKVVGVPYSTVAGFALDLANNTITTAQIRDGAVTASKLAPGAITFPQGPGSGLHADLLDGLHATSFLRLNDDNFTTGSLSIGGLLQPSIGQTKGLSFASSYGGDSGDAAWLRYYPSGRGATAMNLDLGLANDANDQLNLISSGGVFIPSGGLSVTGDLTVSGTINGSVSIPDGSITSAKIADGAVGSSDLAASFADGSAYDSRFVNASGDTMTGSLTVSGNNNLRFSYAGTQVGDISATDPSWLRLNANTTANIVTPRLLRADGGLFVGGTTYGILSSGDLVSPQVYTSVLRDRDDTANFYIDPNAASRVNNLTVTGTLNALINDPRYLRNDLPATSTQVIFGDLDVRSGSAPGTSFLHPGATDARNWTAVASQVFCSPNYYGPNSTATITIGESNPVSIPGSLTAPALYDAANPAYYVDPSSISVMARLDADALYDRASPGFYVDPSDISILNSVRADRFYSRQDPGNYYLDPDGISYINEIQAYVFRDRNDPNSYYLDPAATSCLRNIRVGGYGGVADDVQAGIMWNNTTDYGIYRESGAWTSPYPDLRIAFQTGIKIGADSAYGGTRFFSGSDMATEIFSVGNGDASVRVNSALYSPITYDKDNAGYFVDPAGTSVVNGLTVNGALTIPNGSIVSGKLSASGSTAGQVLTSNGTSVAWAAPSAGDGLAYDSRFVNTSGDMMTGNLTTSGSLTATALYDAANSAYYVDPASTSNVNNLTVNGTLSAPAGKPELPIAYAYINSDGTKASGTSDLTCAWNATLLAYEITVNGEYYLAPSYVANVTPSASSSVRIPMTTASKGVLIVQMYDLSGSKVQSAFQVVIYKP